MGNLFGGVPVPSNQEGSGFFAGASVPGLPSPEGQSSNQYSPLPNTSAPTPGTIPTYASPPASTTGAATPNSLFGHGSTKIESSAAPGLQTGLAGYLTSQVGQGLPGFNAQTVLPSSGAVTAPGQLNAPTTATLADLQKFFAGGGSSAPGLQQLGDIATKGVDQMPAWQAMVAAQQKNIDEGAAQLREQFNTEGNLTSSPFGTAMGDYYNQAILNQNAQLSQAVLQGVQEQIGAATTLEQADQSLGTLFQGMDQTAINNLLQEFNATLPQNNPLLQLQFAQGNTYAPTVGKQSASQTFDNITAGIAALA